MDKTLIRRISSVFVLVLIFAFALWATTYPVTDAFPGSSLSGNWTVPTGSGTFSVSGGNVTPGANTSTTAAQYTGASFNSNQYSQVFVAPQSSQPNYIGPAVRMVGATAAAAGFYDAACINYSGIYCTLQCWNNGAYSYNIGSQTGPNAATSATIKLTASGSGASTVLNVYLNGTLFIGPLTDTMNCSAGQTLGLGTIAGIFSNVASGNTGTMSSFQADCIPTCGGGAVLRSPPMIR